MHRAYRGAFAPENAVDLHQTARIDGDHDACAGAANRLDLGAPAFLDIEDDIDAILAQIDDLAGDDRIVAATTAGHLLAFPLSELPELDKGKGNKIIDIPKAKLGTERVVAVAAVGPGQSLLVRSGQRTMTLSFRDLEAYLGSRATRGGLLPRGWQKVDGLSVE